MIFARLKADEELCLQSFEWGWRYRSSLERAKLNGAVLLAMSEDDLRSRCRITNEEHRTALIEGINKRDTWGWD